MNLAAMHRDPQFEEHAITRVEKHDRGYEIMHGSWGLSIPDVGIEPKVGDIARFYGRGIGSRVRGVTINGAVVYYRTEAEDAERHEIDTYGSDAADWLRRWDAGGSVWSISMGGLGPGYEQCIQITAAEILRHLLDANYDADKWTSDAAQWKRDRDAIEKAGFANARIDALGLSGAQWGAAMNLAALLYRRGPRALMNDESVKDRRIQVQRTFPQVPA